MQGIYLCNFYKHTFPMLFRLVAIAILVTVLCSSAFCQQNQLMHELRSKWDNGYKVYKLR